MLPIVSTNQKQLNTIRWHNAPGYIALWVLCIFMGVTLAAAGIWYLPRSFDTGLYWLIALSLSIPSSCIFFFYVLIPTWRRNPFWLSLSIILLSIFAAMTVEISSKMLQPSDLQWIWADTPDGNLSTVTSGESWNQTKTNILEFHATLDTKHTEFGHWRAESDLVPVLEGGSGRIYISLTQPEWSTIDRTTGRVPVGFDGVNIVFRVLIDGRSQTITQIDLDPHDAQQLSWQDITLNLPGESKTLIVEVFPKRTMEGDRVWMTTGILDAPSRFTINSAMRLSVGYLLLAIMFTSIALLQKKPVLVLQSFIVKQMGRYGWVLTSGFCLGLSYLLEWQRGLYLDDYALKTLAVDIITGERLPIFDPSRNPFFPARILTWIVLPQILGLVPEYEFLVRLLLACVIGFNCFLLGYFVYRLLDSRLAGLIAGWLFIAPIYTDVTVWVGALPYLITTGLTLIYLICIWNALEQPEYIWRWLLFGLVAFIVGLLFNENCVAAIGFTPILWLLSRLKHRADLRQGFGSLALIFGTSLVTLSFFYVMLYTQSLVVTGRQGIDLNPWQVAIRFSQFLEPIRFWTIDGEWGGRFFRELFALGLRVINQSWQGILLAIGAVAVLVLTIVSWQSDDSEDQLPYYVGGVVLLLGIIWSIAALAIPYTLARLAIFERRYLYFPGAGLSITVATLAWLVTKRLGSRTVQRAILIGVAVILSCMCVAMVGYTNAFVARSQLSRAQVSAIVQIIPESQMPIGTHFIPYQSDEWLFGEEDIISRYMIGVFETPWSGQAELRKRYLRRDLRTVSVNRWAPIAYSYNASGPVNWRLKIQDRLVPLDRTLIFQYHNNHIALVEKLIITTTEKSHIVIEFPLAQKLVMESGVASIPELMVTEVNP